MSETNLKRQKRRHRVDIEETWECSACTYKNPKESFKCEVCDTRKGTSTRKPKLTNSVIQMQEQLEKVFSKDKDDEVCKKKKEPLIRTNSEDSKNQFKTYFKKIKGLDRQNFEKVEVTSNGFSVVITEYTSKTSCIKNQPKCVSVNSSVSSNVIKTEKYNNNNTNQSRNIWSIAIDNISPSQSDGPVDNSGEIVKHKSENNVDKSKPGQTVETPCKNQTD